MTIFGAYRFYNIYEMIVYVDVLFFQNLILDFIIILATGIICNLNLKVRKMFLASLVSSSFTVFSVIFNMNNMIVKILISIFTVLIAYGFKRRKRFMKTLSVFYLTTITFGGASLMFVNLKNKIKMLTLGIVFGFCLIVFVQKLLKEKFEKICSIEIGYRGKKVNVNALIDSGNLLREEKTKLPVIIVENKALLSILDNDIEIIKIPFSSLGNKNGVLNGFKPDYIKVYNDDYYFEKKAIVGIYKDTLCENSNEYNAIVGL